MKIHNKTVKIAVLAVAILFVLSTAAFAITSVINNSVSSNKDNQTVKNSKPISQELEDKRWASILAKRYGKRIEEILKMKNELGDWEKVALNLFMGENKTLSKEKVTQLYDQGFSLEDIGMAEDLAMLSDKTPEQLLNIKGKAGAKEGKKWDDVITELKIDTRKPAERLGITPEKSKEIKKQGFTDKQIIEVGLLSKNYGKSSDEILGEYKKGKSFDDLDKKYKDEKLLKIKPKNSTPPQTASDIEAKLAKQYNITAEDKKKCGEYGVTSIVSITIAKTYASRYNVTLDKILELKKEKKTWTGVEEALGGEK